MPVVSTDDMARRLRYIYLGPVGFRLPFDARFPAIGTWLSSTSAIEMLAVLASTPGVRVWLVGLFVAPVAATLLTRKVMQHVDHDRPVRWWLRDVLAAELSTPRPPDADTYYRTISVPTMKG